VVKSFTAEAGISEKSGFMLQSIRPDWSAMAIPHWPGALRAAEAYQSVTRELSHCWVSWAAADRGRARRRTHQNVRQHKPFERFTDLPESRVVSDRVVRLLRLVAETVPK
jgi:hypothetical protein